ncbi:hypothetical protein OCU04_011060 [Sclerotinia nivalis]|uniref:Uncharacterized protein n=1 Tax=Sclerotinia nivalis TaxID=352851 RepID=A0A9X0ADC9_9HELO|nr:hypothetical protein OCU04_011060 [Sclerotinia nivalis]
MSCPAPADTVYPVALLGTNPSYINACTAANITSNSDAVNAMTHCCGSASVTVLMDGCYSYCNVTSSTDQQNWEKCFGASINDVDFGCTLDDLSGFEIPGSGTIYPSSTESSAAAASSTVAAVTTTASSGTFTTTATGSAASHSSTSASGTSKASTSSNTSASVTSSGATASATANAGQPTVGQLSKGAVAILALAFVGLLG